MSLTPRNRSARRTSSAATALTEPLFIGIDGGGSGCRARIADADGRALGQGTAPPAAIRFGVDRALSAVHAAARAAAADAGLPRDALARLHAVVGLAGIGRKFALEQLHARPHIFGDVEYVNDAIIACLGAHRGGDGGIIIAGTGSVGLALIGGRETRVGGYGFPISDEASGADLGLRAIRIALRTCDGRIAATDLTHAVMARFRSDPFEAVAWADRATATDYAELAPLVMDHAERNDRIAREIIALAAGELDAMARRLMARGAKRLSLLGGLAPRIASWLASDVRAHLVPARGDAVDGALALARRHFGDNRNAAVRRSKITFVEE